MAENIFEDTEITLTAVIQDGVADAKDVEFIFNINGKEKERVKATFENDSPKAGEKTSCKYTPPLLKDVDPDAGNYELDYHFEYKVDNKVVTNWGSAKFTVWPKYGSLEAVWDKDDAAFKNFQFIVKQSGERHKDADGKEIVYSTKKVEASGGQVADDKKIKPGFAEFPLESGAEFTIEAKSPYEIKSWEEETSYKRKLKGDVKIPGEFVTPKAGAIKQYINLDTKKKGQDGFGHELLVQVGAAGDLNRSQKLGAPGIFLHVKVKFGPEGDKVWKKKSQRNDPKTDLVDGQGDLSDRTEVTAQKEYTGKVELKGPGGTGTFKVNLGKAGGDTCKIEIGGTDAYDDQAMTITNWRRLYYELLAPASFNGFEDVANPDTVVGGTIKDFKAQIRNGIATRCDPIFLEYKIHASQTFTNGQAPDGTLFPGKYIGTPNVPKVYILTDYTFTKYPKNFSVPGGDSHQKNKTVKIKLCDKNYFFDSGMNTEDYSDANITAKKVTVDMNAYTFFLPVSADADKNGADSVTAFKWEAVVDKTILPKTVIDAVQRVDFVDRSPTTRTLKVEETNQNKSVDVKFSKPPQGEIKTDVEASDKTAVEKFIDDRFKKENLKAKGNKITIKIHAGHSSNLQKTRYANLLKIVNDKVAAIKGSKSIVMHPGLDATDNPRKGALSRAAINMGESTNSKIVVDLPDGTVNDPGPGRLVGASQTSAKCKIKLEFTYEPCESGEGLSGQGAQAGENLVVFNTAHYPCSLDSMLHELAHSMKMTVTGSGDAFAKGMPTGKQVDANAIADYKHVGAKGHIYDGKEQAGSHCAYGMSDTNKAKADYNGLPGGTCIMFGEGPSTGPSQATSGFCPECRDYAKARDLSSIG